MSLISRLEGLRKSCPLEYAILWALFFLVGLPGIYSCAGQPLGPILGDPVCRWLGYEKQLEEATKPLLPEISQPRTPAEQP